MKISPVIITDTPQRMPYGEIQIKLIFGHGVFADGRRAQQQPIGDVQSVTSALPEMTLAEVDQIAVFDANL
jgi:hypothetical protein